MRKESLVDVNGKVGGWVMMSQVGVVLDVVDKCQSRWSRKVKVK